MKRAEANDVGGGGRGPVNHLRSGTDDGSLARGPADRRTAINLTGAGGGRGGGRGGARAPSLEGPEPPLENPSSTWSHSDGGAELGRVRCSRTIRTRPWSSCSQWSSTAGRRFLSAPPQGGGSQPVLRPSPGIGSGSDPLLGPSSGPFQQHHISCSDPGGSEV